MGKAATTIEEPQPVSRRERRKQEVRTRIVEAAVEAFEERGPEDTTVAIICERADIAHKTFFNHFPSKQHLLREIADAFVQQLLADIGTAREAAGGTGDKIACFFKLVADATENAGPMHRKLVTEIIQLAHETGSDTEQARQLHKAFGGLIRDGRRAGDVTTRHSIETMTEMIVGAFYVLMFDWALLDDYPIRSRAGAAAKFLADAIKS